MRVPLSWLREFVDWEDGPDALAEALTGRGVAVETVERPGRGAAGIVTARLEALTPHPSAPRLTVCAVAAGGRRGRVVTGAPDIRPGMLVPWALPGAVLPGGREIGVRDTAGVLSEGMLCAADELGLPGGHGGLLDLAGAGVAEGGDLVGPLALDDAILVLELTPNYAVHCQSILGVAREVAAIGGGLPRRSDGAPVEDAGRPAAALARVEVADPDLCPLYVARVAENIGAAPAPLRLARRLAQCGMRPLGGVVDVTNYVMLELGQPLHAFDLERLAGGRVQARQAGPGEQILTLDGRERELQQGDLVIADDLGPVAVAGVMGGRRSEVTAQTRSVLLESATFDAGAVARTARRLGLPSEAAARFSRGVDPGLARVAADRAARLLQETCGAQICSGALQAGPGVPQRSITLRGGRVRALLGIRLSTAACGHHLERLGFTVQPDGPDRLRVVVPGWRPDVAEEVDLVEEVGRDFGFGRIPASLPAGDPGVPLPDPLAAPAAAARTLTLGAGFTEVQPYSYHGPEVADRLRLPPGHPWRQAVRVSNPMSQDQSLLRVSLLPGLLQTLAVNAHRSRPGAAVFELGRVFLPTNGRPDEPLRLGVAGYGPLQPASWDRPADPCDLFAIKGLFEEILARLGVPAHQGWERATGHPELHPGRAAQWRLGERVLCWLGETHPEVTAAYDLPGPAAVGELDIANLAALAADAGAPPPLPRFPAARRDVAVLLPAELTAAEAEAAIAAAGGPLLAEVRLFDVYAGRNLPPGTRSVAFALTYQAERTLTDAEVDAAQAEVRAALAALPGAALRA